MNNKVKHIFIVAHMIRGGGPETFLKELLPKLVYSMQDVQFTCIIAESRKKHYDNIKQLSLLTVSDSILDNAFKRLKFDNFTLVRIVKSKLPDIIFSAGEVVATSLAKLNKPIILVYHATLQFYMKPDANNSLLRLFYTRMMRDRIAKKAEMIVAVSHFERGEIGARYHSHRFEKSAVVYHGVDHNKFYPLRENENIGNILPYKYILCISDFHTHKRMDEMIEIYHLMVNHSIEEHLVLIGREKNHEAFERINYMINNYGLEDKVHIIDYIDNDKLRAIYLNSTFYWTHSRCESFGMTPLEAMACGVPVFAAWRESLPEIYGDSVLFYNPFIEDYKEIANDAVVFLKTKEMLKLYAKKGYECSLRYSWEKAAFEYKKILNNLLYVQNRET